MPSLGVRSPCINALEFLGVRGTPGDLYECVKPIKFKIDDIDPKGRFVNLFGGFSPLCAAPRIVVDLGEEPRR